MPVPISSFMKNLYNLEPGNALGFERPRVQVQEGPGLRMRTKISVLNIGLMSVSLINLTSDRSKIQPNGRRPINLDLGWLRQRLTDMPFDILKHNTNFKCSVSVLFRQHSEFLIELPKWWIAIFGIALITSWLRWGDKRKSLLQFRDWMFCFSGPIERAQALWVEFLFWMEMFKYISVTWSTCDLSVALMLVDGSSEKLTICSKKSSPYLYLKFWGY